MNSAQDNLVRQVMADSILGHLTRHELKILPRFYKEVISGSKTFEIRFNDRDFKVGDVFTLREYENGRYTQSPSVYGKITYVTNYEQKDGYVVFSFKVLVQ